MIVVLATGVHQHFKFIFFIYISEKFVSALSAKAFFNFRKQLTSVKCNLKILYCGLSIIFNVNRFCCKKSLKKNNLMKETIRKQKLVIEAKNIK